MEAGLDAVGDDARAVAKGGGGRPAREATWKEQARDRGAQVEILANHGLEEVTALHRSVEDLRQTDFELAEGDATR